MKEIEMISKWRVLTLVSKFDCNKLDLSKSMTDAQTCITKEDAECSISTR